MVSEKQAVLLGKKICNSVSKGIISSSKKESFAKNIKKKSNGDYTQFADNLAESIIKKVLVKEANKNGIGSITLISEERGVQTFGKSEKGKGLILIADPIDGSSNLRNAITPSSIIITCLAIIPNNTLEIKYAFVADIFNKRLYYAIKGKGAFVENFGRIKTSKETNIDNATLGFDLDVKGEKSNIRNRPYK